MAAKKGDVGQVKFDDGGSSVNPVLGTRSWSMSITKDTQETTVQGDTERQVQLLSNFFLTVQAVQRKLVLVDS